MSETSSAYSSYLSSNWPAEYETKMVEATAHAQKAKIKWGAEKRSGKTREDLEQQIVLSPPDQANHRPQEILFKLSPHTLNGKPILARRIPNTSGRRRLIRT